MRKQTEENEIICSYKVSVQESEPRPPACRADMLRAVLSLVAVEGSAHLAGSLRMAPLIHLLAWAV